MDFIPLSINLLTHILMNYLCELFKVQVSLLILVKQLHYCSNFLFRSTDFQRSNLLFKICVGNIAISILIKLFKDLKYSCWTTKHLVFYISQYFLYPVSMNLIFSHFSYRNVLIKFFWWWVSPHSMIKFFVDISLICKY